MSSQDKNSFLYLERVDVAGLCPTNHWLTRLEGPGEVLSQFSDTEDLNAFISVIREKNTLMEMPIYETLL